MIARYCVFSPLCLVREDTAPSSMHRVSKRVHSTNLIKNDMIGFFVWGKFKRFSLPQASYDVRTKPHLANRRRLLK